MCPDYSSTVTTAQRGTGAAVDHTGAVGWPGRGRGRGGAGYARWKGAINGFTLAVAAGLKEHGVRANVVCPGARTRLSSGPEYEAQITNLHRRGLLDDAAMQVSLDAPPPAYAAPIYAYLA